MRLDHPEFEKIFNETLDKTLVIFKTHLKLLNLMLLINRLIKI